MADKGSLGKNVIFISILSLILCSFIFSSCSRSAVTNSSESTQEKTEETAQLSEQPNTALYKQYFTAFYLAKLPKGVSANPQNVPVKTSVFTAEDQFCTVMEVIKDIPAGKIGSAVYDINAKKNLVEKTAFPMELKKSNYMGSEELKYPTGKYEYKIYIDDTLVAVLPFEVK